jgi:uncharacterized phosphatase
MDSSWPCPGQSRLALCRRCRYLYGDMTEIYLIRHGETEWNRLGRTQGGSDIPLNEQGRQQALETARALERIAMKKLSPLDLPLGGVYSSPLQRAWETAEIICDRLGVETQSIVGEPRVVERHYGSAEGLLIAERKALFGDRNAIPDAEPWESVTRRGIAVMEHIRMNHRNQRVLVVAHGGLINSVLSKLTDGEYTHKMGPLKNAGVTVLAVDETAEWRVLHHNLDGPELEQIYGDVVAEEERDGSTARPVPLPR